MLAATQTCPVSLFFVSLSLICCCRMEKNSRQHKHPVSPPCHYSAHALPHLPPAEPSYSEGRNSKHWARGFHAAVSWMGLKTARSNSFSCVLVEKSTLWHFSKGIYHHSVMVNTSQELFCTLIYFVARVFKLLSNSDLQPKLPVKTNVNLSLRWKRSYSCITLQSVEITACHAINFSLCYCCSLMCNSGS